MDALGLADRLRPVLGDDAVITDHQRLRTYECDGLAHYKVTPALVVLPETTAQVAAVVRACAAGRGAVRGPRAPARACPAGPCRTRTACSSSPRGCAASSSSTADNQRAVVQPGVINLQLSREALPLGYYYAPDPSSQQVCSIGGNVAENSGGAHCLKYGFTTNHVTGVELVTARGRGGAVGGKAPDAPGYDLLGVLVGSEGTLGIATEVTVRLTRSPESVRTLLAAFEDTDAAGAAVSAIIGAGVIPAAIEMMDALAIEAAEAAVHCGYPAGAGAVLIVELDGPARGRGPPVRPGRAVLPRRTARSRSGSRSTTPSARCSGRGASPRSPRSAGSAPTTSSRTASSRGPRCPRSCAGSPSLSAEKGVRVANVFHAGDGNLHPLVLFDDAVPGEAERAEEVSGAILDLCIEHGGSITGEHGVGSDKAKYMPRMFDEDDLDTMQLVRCAFDPDSISNPGKVFPTPRLCGEVPGRHRGAHPLAEAGVAEVF